MSISPTNITKTREVKLKIGKAFHLMNVVHAEVFPAYNPGFYNNALGRNRLKKWYDRKEKYDNIQYSWMTAAFSLIGTMWISHESSNVFGWLFLTIGLGFTAISFLEHALSKHESEKEISNLKDEIQKQTIEIEFMKERLNRLENSKLEK